MRLIKRICEGCIGDVGICRERGIINRLESVRRVLSTEYTDAFDLLAGMASCPNKKSFRREEATDD